MRQRFGGRLYRQSVPAIGLSLERATPAVADDGCFYVLVQGDVKGRFRGKREALALYASLLEQSGYKPEPAQVAGPKNEAVERYLDELEAYWLESHKHQRRGGKGRN